MLSSWNEDKHQYEDDSIKDKIFNAYIKGTSEEEIINTFGDYGKFYLDNLKKILLKFIPKF